MNKIRIILKNYRLRTGIFIILSLIINKLIGKYLFFFFKTESFLKLQIPFKEVSSDKIQIDYNNLKITCRKFSSDINVVKQIFLGDEFNDLHEQITKHGIEIKTIVDLGGNIGISSLWFDVKYRKPKIYIVEPDVENFKILEENLRINNVHSINIQKGIWKDSRRLYFNRSFRDAQSWSVTLTEDPLSDDYIESISINDLISQYQIPRIDLLKMDIEGGEAAIFNQNSAALDFLRITKVIAIEIHPEFDAKEKITNTLSCFGFTFFKSGEYFIGINEAF